jgi:hypothetical protein
MAGTKEGVVPQNAKEAALRDFEEGVRRSIEQADAGLVETFKTPEELLDGERFVIPGGY